MIFRDGVWVGETKEEITLLRKHRSIVKGIWSKSHERAKLVFDKFIEGGDLAYKGDDSDESDCWGDDFAALILDNLDERSIGSFVDLVLVNSERAQRASMARKGAMAKLANDKDGKQAAKAIVRGFWEDWQRHPDRYKGKSAFARDMLEKFPNLASQRVISDRWCSMWEKGNITMPAE